MLLVILSREPATRGEEKFQKQHELEPTEQRQPSPADRLQRFRPSKRMNNHSHLLVLEWSQNTYILQSQSNKREWSRQLVSAYVEERPLLFILPDR
jgi:hypothetical protein